MKDSFKFLFLTFLLGSLICACGKREAPRKQTRSKESLKGGAEQAAEESDSVSKDFVLSPDKYGRKDPFNPVFERKARLSGKGLSGIVWDEQNPKAVIAGDIVGVGDKIGLNTVIEITRDKVILSDGSNEFELRLGR